MNPKPPPTLDRELPLALLPVRLEARYLPRGAPTELVVRVFPDEIHADGHDPALTVREERAGHAYWQVVWENEDAAAVGAARTWLAGQCGPYRALWVATATTPTGRLGTGLTFPEVTIRKDNQPARARVLPDRWIVRLYDAQRQLAHTTTSLPIREGLAIAPTLAAIDPDAIDPQTGKPHEPLDAFLGGQGLDWMTDVTAAVDAGMAVRIPIGAVPNPVGTLLVTGVRAGRDPLAEADELESLVTAHWYTRGFDVVPQGTPTNNSDAGRSGVSLAAPDLEELFTREVSERPMAPGGRALLMAADPAMMYRVPAADALSLALGRLRANTFDRTSHAETVDGLAAWAMNLAIGFATLGDYLDGPLAMLDGRTAAGEQTPALRDWFIDWVRGGATLPAIRCGGQPYGLLAVTPPAPQAEPGDDELRDLLGHHLARIATTWTRSLPTSALDPEATDARPSMTPAADAVVVGEVLGAVPHPTSLQLRDATDNTQMDGAALVRATGQVDFDIMREPVNPGTDAGDLVQLWRATKPTIDGIPNPLVPDAAIPDIHTQLGNAEAFRDALAAGVDDLEFGAEALAHVDDDLLPLLRMHRDATERVPPQLAGFNESGGLGATDVIRLVHTTFESVPEPVTRLVTTAGDITELGVLLTALIDALDEIATHQIEPMWRQRLVTGPAPLLHHLLDQNHLHVPIADAPRVKVALQVLQAGANSTAIDVEATLERLLRESLGLGIHRIDAWVSSLAGERLAAKRRQRPAGIQLGAYGWLLDLAPSDDPVTQGFIHAPSLSHAATAAVLRSGWQAFGIDAADAPLSVDLSSDRVRGGTWILDGVRNGQDLAETLGSRFERFLHDGRLDDWIERIRRIVLDVTGAGGPPSAVVDGLLVARAFSDAERNPVEGELHRRLRAETAPTADPAESAEGARVRRALTAVAADLDSVADLTMAQSVHALLRGNSESASAALAVTGGGDAAVPPITVTASQRDAQLVSHRVVAVWPVDGPPPAATSVLGVAEPRLTAWLESLLPAPGRVSAGVVVRDATGAVAGRGTVTLADVGLRSLEAAHLAGGQPGQAGSRLGRIVAAVAADRSLEGGSVEIAFDVAGRGHMSVDDFGLLAVAALDAAGRGRALRPADLVVAGGDPTAAVEDVVELADRLSAVEEQLDQIAADLAASDPAVVRAALLRASAIDVPGAVAAIEADATDESLATVLAALVDRRTAAGTGIDDTAVDGIAEHLHRLVNGVVTILPVFTPAPDADRSVSAASARLVADVDDMGHRWLRQVARVRPAVGALNDVLLLAETMSGTPLARLGVVQLPHHDEGWAATGPIVGRRERLALLSLTGTDVLAAEDQPLAGFLVDGWTEGIPASDQLSGIAVHFDAPTARAPNAVLLSVVDEQDGFSADGISAQLLHVINLMKLRAIPPTGLAEHGHYLPTIFLPEDIEMPEIA